MWTRLARLWTPGVRDGVIASLIFSAFGGLGTLLLWLQGKLPAALTWMEGTVGMARWMGLALFMPLFFWGIWSIRMYRTLSAFRAANTESTDVTKIELDSEQAKALQWLFDQPAHKWVSPFSLAEALGHENDQRALGLLESLRRKQITIRARYSKGHDEFRLSESGRQLMLDEGHKLPSLIASGSRGAIISGQ